jgi:2-dehydropantoate 2-reductase
MTDTFPSVLIVGAGAVGSLYGAALASQRARVSVVCRSDFDAVKREGFYIRSAALGEHRFRPEQVFRNVEECSEPPEYLILTVKVLEGVDRIELIRPAVGPRTTILLIENGIDIEQPIAAAFPENELLSGIAFAGVARIERGDIHHQTAGPLVMGRFPRGITPAAQRLAALLEASKVGCKLRDDIVGIRWQKTVWNATFNPLSILGGGLDTAAILAGERNEAFVRAIMQEICAVAAAVGHPQRPNLIDQMIAGTRAIPPYKTSMALDFEHRRPMEVEAILGNTVRAGQRAGVAIPQLETLYTLAKMIERDASPSPAGEGLRTISA